VATQKVFVEMKNFNNTSVEDEDTILLLPKNVSNNNHFAIKQIAG